MFGIVIPVFNYEKGLESTLGTLLDWRKAHPDLPFWVCFINDGSTDTSGEKLATLSRQYSEWVKVIDFKQNQGKGACVRAGFLALSPHCQQIFFTDCDLYYGLGLIKPALAELENCDIVILDRSLFSSYGKRSFYRNFASKFLNKTICLLTGVSILDTQAGFKAFRTDICLPLFKNLQIARFAFDMELLAYASKYLLRVHALPVVLSPKVENEKQKSTISLANTFEVIRDIFRIACILSRPLPFDQELKDKLAHRTHKI